jgi:hypothetical protein
MKPICDICGTRHESYQAHVFASTQVMPATNRIATNKSVATNRSAVGVVQGDAAGGVAGEVVPGKSKNRRSREAYNTYQREYMRKRRAK